MRRIRICNMCKAPAVPLETGREMGNVPVSLSPFRGQSDHVIVREEKGTLPISGSRELEDRLDGRAVGRVLEGPVDLVEGVEPDQPVERELPGLEIFDQLGNE